MVRKVLLLFLFIIFFGFFPSKIFAQQNNYPINTESNVPQNFHNYTQSTFIEIFSALSCQLSGIDPTNPNGQCLGVDQKTGKIGFVKNGGVLGFVNNSMTAMYDIPIHSNDYFKTLASNFGIAKKAVAAVPLDPSVSPGEGAGFKSLIPFQGLWKTMRNIVYVFFVLLFLFVGLGIMFRVKIDPRTVMTIQNQLPKIVVALILVTFSYAIAGFLVDMMNVSMYLGYGIVAQADSAKVVELKPTDIQGTNPFGVAGKLGGDFGLAGLVSEVTGSAVGAVKDAAGLGQLGGPNVPSESITNIPGVESFFSGLVKIIPGIDLLGDIFGKIPGIGYFFGLLNKVGAATGITTQFSYINYFIHTVSVGAGIFGGIHAATIVGKLCGGLTGGLSLLGFGGSAGFQFCPGETVSVPVAIITGVSIAALTEAILREFIPNLLGFFLVLSIFITALLRLWYQLLKAYILVILGIIFAPLWIALGVIPGSQNVGFTPWLRNLAANLSVFPVTYIMFLIAKILVGGISSSNNTFLPPFIGGQNASQFGAIFALGIILLTPQVLEIVRDFFKVQRFKYGAAITSSLAVGQQMVGAPIKGTMSKVWGVDPYTKEPKKLTRIGLERFSRSQSSIGKGLGKVFSLGVGEKEGIQQQRIINERKRGARFAELMRAKQEGKTNTEERLRRDLMRDYHMNNEDIDKYMNAEKAKAEKAAQAEATAGAGQSQTRGPEVATKAKPENEEPGTPGAAETPEPKKDEGTPGGGTV